MALVVLFSLLRGPCSVGDVFAPKAILSYLREQYDLTEQHMKELRHKHVVFVLDSFDEIPAKQQGSAQRNLSVLNGLHEWGKVRRALPAVLCPLPHSALPLHARCTPSAEHPVSHVFRENVSCGLRVRLECIRRRWVSYVKFRAPFLDAMPTDDGWSIFVLVRDLCGQRNPVTQTNFKLCKCAKKFSHFT